MIVAVIALAETPAKAGDNKECTEVELVEGSSKNSLKLIIVSSLVSWKIQYLCQTHRLKSGC